MSTMKASWRIARIAGIDVYMHATFLILLAWVAIGHYLQRNSWSDAAYGLLFIGALFTIIVLHELGHALTARRFGIQTRDITLLPIGGVARLERMPDDPKQELLVALAGPAVNVVLAVILYLIIGPTSGMSAFDNMTEAGGSFLGKLLWVNIFLAGFNMLPAFPMDGGRVLRAVLAMRMDYVQATHVAAAIGQGMAFLFGLLGLLSGNPFLLFIALFVWMGAAQEASMTQIRYALGGIPISRAMVTGFQTLEPDDPLSSAIDHIVAGFQQDFPVVEDQKLVGMLTRADLISGLAKHGTGTAVRDVMQTQFTTAEPTEMLDRLLPRLEACGCHSVPVVHKGNVVGLMTMDELGEFLMIQSALRAKGGVDGARRTQSTRAATYTEKV
jgi:Zn-dependent protease/predicted transcriptional regulator